MKYTDIKYNELSSEMFDQLRKGVFMTTKVGNKVNTMTIAWGGINIVWNKSLFVAYVRYSRDTYNMVDETNEFTISVPLNKDMKKELSFCGTKSGRDYDKIKECNLNVVDSRTINTPILADCELHYECKEIYKQAMEPSNLLKSVKERYYNSNDFHVIFYGEILDSYLIKGE
jgi:flavin reductase (DIM6/NTAB) family NADH-FMN oxidoreductase RutF